MSCYNCKRHGYKMGYITLRTGIPIDELSNIMTTCAKCGVLIYIPDEFTVNSLISSWSVDADGLGGNDVVESDIVHRAYIRVPLSC